MASWLDRLDPFSEASAWSAVPELSLRGRDDDEGDASLPDVRLVPFAGPGDPERLSPA